MDAADPDSLTFTTLLLINSASLLELQNIVLLLCIPILLCLSGMFSGSEVAFFSLNPNQLNLLRNSDSKNDHLVLQLLSKPKRLLAVLLIGNTFVNISIILTTSLFISNVFDFENNALLAFLLEVVLVTFVLVIFGEVTPKVLATKRNVRVARMLSYFIFVVDKLLSPFSVVLMKSTDLIEGRMKKKGYQVTMAELTHAIEIASDETTPKEEKKILKGIVRFSDIDVKQIMKYKPDIVALRLNDSFERVIKVIQDSGYSRIPVYEKDLDNVAGILYSKDLVKHISNDHSFNWQSLLRKTFIVPESKKINDLLQEFKSKKVHMAIVVDEYGSTQGLITLEDVLEEIVGEMTDEFDDEEILYSKLDDDNYVFEAKILINDMCKVMELDENMFDTIDGETDTLAGLILELEGRIPLRLEQINFKNILFTIESSDKRRIKRVKVTRQPLTHNEEGV
ncbi:MAG TPA: gliding motility-associated protein GldE [Bacteroidia bacterium]|nr:gliding motility-associated protein GldE [Bacteroidia bacterium]HNT79057.1 gliding motility-associated protein GldE [Bacteroidia bacterium]